MKHPLTFFAAAFAVASIAQADVTLPAVFSNDMVLQRGVKVPVWGWAAADEEVSVSFAGQSQKVKADAKGAWKVALEAMKERSEPADLVVTGKNTVTLKNVVVGEVWICSGQSNMQWVVADAGDAKNEIANAQFPLIRMFNVERVTAMQPQKDLKGKWLVCDPANTPNFSAVAYFFGRRLHQELKVPVGLINTSWGGTRAEAWTSREALEQLPSAKSMLDDWAQQLKTFDPVKAKADYDQQQAEWLKAVDKLNEANTKLAADQPKAKLPPAPRPAEDPTKTPHHPSVLYNQMIAPLVPYAIKGAIWYQGESNQKRAVQYQELLPTMINDWRERWKAEFPFYIVQLAGFGNGRPLTAEAGVPDTWAELQEAQMLTAITLSHCGVAVTNDIGEEGNIHPKNKQEVGRRLALWALANDYGTHETLFSGPIYKGSKIEGKKVRIEFTYGQGLKTRDGGEPQHFQITGADQKWQWAKAKIENGGVVVWSDSVAKPVGVRYAWAAWAPSANLVNLVGLPASCFRTDEFPLSTLGVVSPFAESLPVRR